jgi:hypothetical protein
MAARRAPGIRTHGSAGQLADHGVGYSANGESEFSRAAASTPNIKLSAGKRTDGRLIRETERELRKLQQRAREERDPKKLEKISSNVTIKTGFLARLKLEQREAGK